MQMKSLFKSWRDTTNVSDEVLLESRLSDTLAKYPQLAEFIKDMAEQDPSGNNKYLDYFAKILNAIAKKAKDFRPAGAMERRILAQEPESARAEEIMRSLKNQAALELRDRARALRRMIISFHNYQTLWSEKDIYKYKTYESLDAAHDEAQAEIEKRELEKRYAKQAKQDIEVVYSSHNMIVRRINSHTASMLFGLGTQWCITQRDSPSYWEDYERQGNAFFFLELKNNPPRNNKQKYAFQLNREGLESIYDEEDNPVDEDEVVLALHEHLIRGSKDKESVKILVADEDFFTVLPLDDHEEMEREHEAASAKAYRKIVSTTFGWTDPMDMRHFTENLFNELTSVMEYSVNDNPPGPNWEESISDMEDRLSHDIAHVSWHIEYEEGGWNGSGYISTAIYYRIPSEDFEELPWREPDEDYDAEIRDAAQEYPGWTIDPEIEVYNHELSCNWRQFELEGDIEGQLNDFYYYAEQLDNEAPALFEHIVGRLKEENHLIHDNTATFEEKILQLKDGLDKFEMYLEGKAIYVKSAITYDVGLFKKELSKHVDTRDFSDFGWGDGFILPSNHFMTDKVNKKVAAFYKKLAAQLTDNTQLDLFSPGSTHGAKNPVYDPPGLTFKGHSPDSTIKAELIFKVGEFDTDAHDADPDNEEIEFDLFNSLSMLKYINDNANEAIELAMFKVLLEASAEINQDHKLVAKPITETKTINVNKRSGDLRELHNKWKNFLK